MSNYVSYSQDNPIVSFKCTAREGTRNILLIHLGIGFTIFVVFSIFMESQPELFDPPVVTMIYFLLALMGFLMFISVFFFGVTCIVFNHQTKTILVEKYYMLGLHKDVRGYSMVGFKGLNFSQLAGPGQLEFLFTNGTKKVVEESKYRLAARYYPRYHNLVVECNNYWALCPEFTPEAQTQTAVALPMLQGQAGQIQVQGEVQPLLAQPVEAPPFQGQALTPLQQAPLVLPVRCCSTCNSPLEMAGLAPGTKIWCPKCGTPSMV
mmetsp:Transcript_11655/g.22179  ORF Transcript_11655/g.22179 Transcript_11655/m.22179 type:complete len:264 (+) Transcript_11655:16-807(+)